MKNEKSILLVDDSKELNDAAARVLRKSGFNVIQAFDGTECLSLLSSVKPHIVLLDVVMPGMDGIEVCRKIKSDPGTANSFVVLLSGMRVSPDQQADGLNAGADGYIVRPVQNSELVARINSAMRLVDSEKNLSNALANSQRNESKRKKAEKKTRLLNEELELRVAQRTEQLEAAIKELSDFSYSVAHDLRAPLRAVSCYSSILEGHFEKYMDDEGRRLFSIVKSNGTRMGELIDALLLYTNTGRGELNSGFVEMNDIVNKVIAELTPLYPGINFKIDVEALPPAEANEHMIKEVWSNLISNALKFSSRSESPQNTIGSGKFENMIEYYIKDNGAGFDQRFVNKLFNVFERLHTTDEFTGHGIGLAIVRRIIHRHDGTVRAEGEVGKGATFYFTLPDKNK